MKIPLLLAGLSAASLALQQGLNVTSTAEAILKAIEDASECTACQGILTTLKTVALLGDRPFNDVIIEVCKLSGAEDDDVCTGAINAEGPSLAHSLRRMLIPSHTSTLLCANLLGLCQYPDVRPYNLHLPQPKKQRSKPKPSKRDPIQVIHISDTHIDLSYTTGANYNCTKPICCRPFTPADAPGNTSYPAGPWGNHACDPPERLEVNMINAINEHIPNSAFTIFTGDVPPHDVWLVDRREVTQGFDVTYKHMEKLRLAYPALGNHDTAPVNLFPPKGLDIYNKVNPQWTYNKLSQIWKQWIGAAGAKSTDDYGSYSIRYPGTNLRVISYNSISYYVSNFWMYEDPMEFDPNGQFAWFIRELQAAETAGERVWLLAHIPSGSSDVFRDYSNSFDKIVQRYHATIAATFYGHTHKDEFQIAYSNYHHQTAETARMVGYIAPSMTPTSGSPSFRVYSVDPETFAVLDYTQWIANISSPQYQKEPKWTKYYSAKELYGKQVRPQVTDAHAELDAAFWHSVTTLFERNDAAFQGYYNRRLRGYSNETCAGDCKTQLICAIRAANSVYNCAMPTPGLEFTKREAKHDRHGHADDECGESRMRSIFDHIQRKNHRERERWR